MRKTRYDRNFFGLNPAGHPADKSVEDAGGLQFGAPLRSGEALARLHEALKGLDDSMIFCKKCGRYYNDGTPSCGACGADLAMFGDVAFGGEPVKFASVQDHPSKTAVLPASPRPVTKPAPARALPLASISHRETTAVALLDEPSLENESDCAEPAVEPGMDPVFDRDKFLLRQKALAIKEKYYVSDEHGSSIMFVERPALLARQLLLLAAIAVTFFGGTFVVGLVGGFLETAFGGNFARFFPLLGFPGVLALIVLVFVKLVPRRHVTFYRDDSKTEKLLEIRQLNKLEFPYARYTVLDPNGNLIGSLRKNLLFDYIRRRWYVKDANGIQVCLAKEDSILFSLLRRTGIPIFLFMRTNFIFVRAEEVIGVFNRKLTLLDRYVLDVSADTQRVLDRRIALALGVMLDTGERR